MMIRLTRVHSKLLLGKSKAASLLNGVVCSIKLANNYSSKYFKEKENNMIKHYSSTSTIKLPHHDNNTSKKSMFITLDPVQYKAWTREQVCSLLVANIKDGGAGLTLEDVQPLYQVGFKGSSLSHIILRYGLNERPIRFHNLFSNNSTTTPRNTISTIVTWTETLLKTRLYHLWTVDKVREELCKSVKKGGAGLTGKMVQPLYKGGFNGSHLANIATCIQEKDKFFAMHKMNMDFDISQSALMTVVNWVERLIEQVTIPISINTLPFESLLITTPDSIIQARTDPKFEYLRDLYNDSHKWKALESKIGQNIELPNIGEMGSEYVPKDYNPNIPYLLTRQRFDILKQVVERKQDGYVFSGPFGISKSYTMLLIAVYAIVNAQPLLYIPKCGLWVKSFFRKNGNHFLKQSALYYNSDFLNENQLEALKITTNVMSVMNYIGKEFRYLFYLFDEHDEIFRQVQKEEYFTSFTCWIMETWAPRSITIYSGSAHSKFENDLQKESISRVIRMIPPSFSEFKVLVQNFGFNLNEEMLRKVEYATGRNPGELKLFSLKVPKNFTDEHIKMFICSRMCEYQNRLWKLQKECNELEIENILITMHQLFNLAFISDTSRLVSVSGILYDEGLLFKDSDEKIYPINEAAKRALFSFYLYYYKIIGN